MHQPLQFSFSFLLFNLQYVKKKILSLFNLYSGDASLKNAPNLVHIVNLLLDNFRQCQKMDFRPDPFLVQSLLEAGFEKQKILEALKITGNNHDNAVSTHNL